MQNLDSVQICQAIREEYRQDAERRGKQCPGGYWISSDKNCGGSKIKKIKKKAAAVGLAANAVAAGGLAAGLAAGIMKKRKGTDQKMPPGSTGQKALPGSAGQKALPPASRPRLDAGQSKQCPGGYRIPANKNCGGSKTKKKVAAAGLATGAVAAGVLASKLMKKRKGTDQKMLPGSTGQKALPGSTGRKALPGSPGQKALPGGGTPQPIGGGGPQPRLGPASVARASFKETTRKREMAS